MTTLRDLLNDFAKDVEANEYNKTVAPDDVKELEDIIDDYIEVIKERIIG